MSEAGPRGERAARRALVRGRVQGVAFRYFACEKARELGLAGWVRNLPDGRVEARFEGGAEDVERFTAWLHRGPPAARVEAVELHEAACEGRNGFEIAR